MVLRLGVAEPRAARASSAGGRGRWSCSPCRRPPRPRRCRRAARRAPSITAFIPEPHILLSVVAGTSLGSPAREARLPRRRLALAGGQHAAHQELVDRAAGRGRRGRAPPRWPRRRARAREAGASAPWKPPIGGAGGGDDDDGVLRHAGLPRLGGAALSMRSSGTGAPPRSSSSALDRQVAAGAVEGLAGHGRDQLGAREALGAGGVLAEGEDQPPDAAAGEVGPGVHRPDPRRLARRVEAGAGRGRGWRRCRSGWRAGSSRRSRRARRRGGRRSRCRRRRAGCRGP